MKGEASPERGQNSWLDQRLKPEQQGTYTDTLEVVGVGDVHGFCLGRIDRKTGHLDAEDELYLNSNFRL